MDNTNKSDKKLNVQGSSQDQERVTWGRKIKFVRKSRIWQPKENHVMAIA
jgi:hypothetical protein